MSSPPRPSRRLLVLGFASAALTLFALGCTPTYPDCDNDDHCRAKGEYCVGGKCQQCRTADQCGPCNTCNAGACAVVPGCCAQDRDCSVGQACRQGRCGPECLDATECGEGAKCSSGRCVPDVECTSAGAPTSVRSSTTASVTPAWARSACSISPSSMRCPRSFTWKSRPDG